MTTDLFPTELRIKKKTIGIFTLAYVKGCFRQTPLILDLNTVQLHFD